MYRANMADSGVVGKKGALRDWLISIVSPKFCVPEILRVPGILLCPRNLSPEFGFTVAR